jgi:hypothetical protein
MYVYYNIYVCANKIHTNTLLTKNRVREVLIFTSKNGKLSPDLTFEIQTMMLGLNCHSDSSNF